MTLLGRSDGDNYESGCSYLDLAQFIVQQAACHLAEIRKSVARWHDIAQKLKIPRREIDEMSTAFNH